MSINLNRAYILIFSLIAFSCSIHAQEGTVYIFNGTVDDAWSNQANWTPAYPGRDLISGDVIIIEAECFANFLQLSIEGSLRVSPNMSLTLRSTDLIINGQMNVFGEFNLESGSTFLNDGDFELTNTGFIGNSGDILNNASCTINGAFTNAGSVTNEPFGELIIAESGNFVNEQYLTNNGILEISHGHLTNNLTLDNNKDLFISGTIVNSADVTSVGFIYIDGLFINQDGAYLYNHKTIEISASGSLMNFGNTEIFDVAQLLNTGIIENNATGNILNRGSIVTKGNLQFYLKSGSYLENLPGSTLTVNQ